MNRKFIVAILLVAALPAYVQAQNPRVSKGDAQKVATIISSDKIKTQAYCDIQKLAEQVAEANEKKDVGRVNELFEKIETVRSFCRHLEHSPGCVRSRSQKSEGPCRNSGY